MRVAVAYFNELKKEDLVWALLQNGYDAQIIDLPISIYSVDQKDAATYADFIRGNGIEAVLTYDFSAALSNGCQMCSIPYISWIYDCPQKALYEKEVANDCNFIFSFDKKQVEVTKRHGGKHVFYQPLGTNILRNSGIVITKADEKKYSCDVSFVGNLFSNGIYELCEAVATDATKKEYRAILEDAYDKWDGIDRIHGKLSAPALDNLIDIGREEFEKDYRMDLDDFFGARLFSYELAKKERIHMLEKLAGYDIKFFTGEKNINIPGISPHPPINYMDDLPKLYHLSKINMNITLHSITEGIPLRVFDIMGAGGFVLSNYQPAIEEEFDIDKEIVVYRNLDEMEDKVRYYLSHEEARQRIAANGHKAVKKRFNNEIIIKDMIEKALSLYGSSCKEKVVTVSENEKEKADRSMQLDERSKDELKKKIQRLEWWPEETADEVISFARNAGLSDDELLSYLHQYALDADYVHDRLNGAGPRDLFYRNQDVIEDICLDWNTYREKELLPQEKIAFICCCNNDDEYDEMMAWINRLWIPEGMELETLKITEAVSMCSGYNEAMNASDARFKVYLHQDVRIINPYFIFDCLDVFRRYPKAGMIGMMGAGNVPENGVMWKAARCGAVVHVEENGDGKEMTFHEKVSYGKDFSAALTDGFIMVTRVDIPWREDIFTGWHFYDASQSMEFLKQGYEIIIPEQKQAWCMHDFGKIRWDNYDETRKVFVENYITNGEYRKIRLAKPVVIVVVSYNSKAVMQANIESIRKYADEGSYKIVVVDNASTDGVAEWLSQQEDILFIRNLHNAGYGPACNQGVKATVGVGFEDSDIFILNNDTRITPGAIEMLKEALYSSADTGAVGCVANRAGNKQQIDVIFDNVEDYISYGEKNNVPMDIPCIERVRLSGFGMLIRRDVWDEIGGFDEDFVPGYFEDDALSMEILRRGYRLKVVRNSFIYHIGTESFKNVDIDSYVYKNYQLFMKKYGFDIIPYSDASGDVVSHIPYMQEDRFYVLHFGCGLGADIKAVRSVFPNSIVKGIEGIDSLRNIASATEAVYKSLEDYISDNDDQKIDVLVISKEDLGKMSDADKDIIVKHFTDKTALLYKENNKN